MEVLTMNDAPQTRDTSITGSTLMVFSLGAVLGAGLALLLAPDSGRNTRQRLASTARRWGASAGHTFERARDTVAELGTDAKSAIKAGQEAFTHDRAMRESSSERRMSSVSDAATGLSHAQRSNEEAVR
jgi:gas vesicle protein